MPSAARARGPASRLPGPILPLLLLLATLFAASVRADAPAVPLLVNATGKYKYLGCYNETTGVANSDGSRTLDGGSNEVLPGNMTVELCAAFCGNAATPYKFAGLEYSRECWCAQTLSSAAQLFPDSACDLACDGNATEVCGGTLKLSVYQLGAASSLQMAYGVGIIATIGAMAANVLL